VAEREVKVRITGDSSRLARSFRDAEKSGQRFGRTVLRGVGRGLIIFAKAAAVAAAAVGVGLVLALRHGVKGLKEQAKVTAQTVQTLESTGNAAKTTADEIRALTESLERKSGVDADTIQVGSNLLLTFKNIRNEVGANNDIFNRAQETALDMSIVFGTNMKEAAIQLGKALDDPTRGVAALRRSGISFTKSQQETIKSLVESGDILKAQKMILEEIETQVGGSAEAYGKTLPGQIDRANRAFEVLTETLAGPLLEVGVEALEDLLVFFQDPATQANVKAFGEGVRDLAGYLADGVAVAKDFIDQVRAIEGFDGRLEFVLDLGKQGLRKLASRIGDAIKEIDWASVGSTAGAALGAGLKIPAEAVNQVLDLFNEYVVQNADRIADAGAVIAAKIIARLADAEFWIRNWKEALTIALAVLPVGRVVTIGRVLLRLLLRPFAKIAEPLIKPVIEALNYLLVRGAPVAARFGSTVVTTIVGFFNRLAGNAAQFVGEILQPFGRFGIAVARVVETGLRGIGRIVNRVGSQATGLLVRALSEGTAGIAQAATNLAQRVLTSIRDVFGRLPRIIRVLLRVGIANSIVNFIAEAVEKARQLGNDIIDGVTSGINNAASRVRDALVRAVGDPIAVAKQILGISSPSRVTANEIGRPMADGIIAGIIERRAPMVKALQGVIRDTLNSAAQDARSNLSSLASGLAGMLADIFGRSSAQAQELASINAARAAREAARREQEIRDAIAQVDERATAERDLQTALTSADREAADERRRIEEQLASDLSSARSRADRIAAQERANAALLEVERKREEAILDARAEHNRRLIELDRERAQAEQDLADFLEDQRIAELERDIQQRQEAYETDLANLVERFNSGAISAEQFRDELNTILGDASGDALGAAFAGAFGRQLEAIALQVGELLGIAPGIAGPGVVSPSDQVYAEQLRNWRDEYDRLLAASQAARKEYEDALKDAKGKDSPGGATITKAERDRLKRLKGRWDTAKGRWQSHKAKKPVKMAMGGILKRAVVAGEAGPEAVIPLSSARGVDYLADVLEEVGRRGPRREPASGPVIINVTVNGNEFSAHEFARKLAPELKRQVAMTRSR
jgi:hypothetical protein